MALRFIINEGKLFSSPRYRIFRAIKAEFGGGIETLKTFPAPRASNPSNPPSMLFYGVEYDEVNRTLVSVKALSLLNYDEYTEFAFAQDPAVKLTYDSFQWIRAIVPKVLDTPDGLYTLKTSIITNNLGKSSALTEDFQRLMSENELTFMNHDMLLHHIVSLPAQLLPCLARLPPRLQTNLKQALEIGSVFNFLQLARAEAVPVSFARLDCVKENQFAFELQFLKQLLDISGVAGHEEHTGAKKLIEPIFQSYKDVTRPRSSIFKVYSTKERRTMLFHSEASNDWSYIQVEKADLVVDAFYSTAFSPFRWDRALIDGLNLDGEIDEPAVQAIYIPSMFVSAIRATQNCPIYIQKRVLAFVFVNLARILILDPPDWKGLPDDTVVIERDVRGHH
ncbi:uncharacterized protein KD926_011620 [Aspergillus affinis]|uniref:uncharacterized protein n=1 Tax=Aspergillus affinis TaxID=1070780 RepID=UPI0022FE14FD|nr:uncharacterized protein KD926_011620 [Aspergillus affinis]KAI9044650.1 hypothetical protein KD926_011620 [Aspergillus affinis]